MSCHNQGTASEPVPFDLGEAGSGGSIDFLQAVPTEFTRTELRKLLDKANALAQYGIFDDTKRELLVDLAETLDLLDALAARDELDIQTMTEEIRGDPHYVPYIKRAHPRPDTWVHVSHKAPPCGPNCTLHFIGEE